MDAGTPSAGLAALAICEALLLSLTENGILDEAEVGAILEDAASLHRNAAAATGFADHTSAADLIEVIRTRTSSRRPQPPPSF